jgi:hypothetical protein
MATKKKQKTMTVTEELQLHLDHLRGQVQRIRLSFTFKGTQREQARTSRLLASLSYDAQLYIVANALSDLDHFGVLAGVMLQREEALKNEMLKHRTAGDI